ncbi:MAG TPA: hypothetical protein VEB22_14495, partial [Phycisphaerales bacterium]|nr:hypothetical protein [Phycisphaerales bacterium]
VVSVRRALLLTAVGAVAAAVTAGAGMAASRRGAVARAEVVSAGEGQRFEWVDVYVRAAVPVGAWQVELNGVGGSVAFVGLEGDGRGSEPPAYDAAALAGGERLVIGAMRLGKVGAGRATGDKQTAPPAFPLRAGEMVRVARVHVRASGSVEYRGVLVALGDVDGKRIEGTVELVRGEAGQP